MKVFLHFIFAAVIICQLAACASRPAGISKSEWQALTPEKQAEYHRRESKEQRYADRDSAVLSETMRLQDAHLN